MTTIQERFHRTYSILRDECASSSEEELEVLKRGGLNLMWLRNEASLWEDYEEDADMIIDGCNQDPNHPDNLSSIVWESFKTCHLGWFD